MNLSQSVITVLFCLGSTTGFAMSNSDSPECKYWDQRLIDLEAQIEKAQNKLTRCEQSSSDCNDEKQFIISLEMEKKSTESFLKNNCQ